MGQNINNTSDEFDMIPQFTAILTLVIMICQCIASVVMLMSTEEVLLRRSLTSTRASRVHQACLVRHSLLICRRTPGMP